MKSTTIIKRLRNYLPEVIVTELSLAFAIRPSITICCTVNEIIKSYQSNFDNDREVVILLQRLLKIHFSNKNKRL